MKNIILLICLTLVSLTMFSTHSKEVKTVKEVINTKCVYSLGSYHCWEIPSKRVNNTKR